MEDQNYKIIETSNRLFEQYGIRSVSIDNVCSELRISKKTFYIHFTQKEDLVDAVLTFQKNKNVDKFKKLLKNKNAIDSLIVIIKEIKKTIETESQTMCYDLEKYYPNVYEKHENQRNNDMKIGFEINIRQGIAEGFYREDLDIDLVSLFHSIQIKNTFEMMLQSSKKYTRKQLLDFFFDLIIRLIANEKGLKYIEENYRNVD